jgi:hypothetical protein
MTVLMYAVFVDTGPTDAVVEALAEVVLVEALADVVLVEALAIVTVVVTFLVVVDALLLVVDDLVLVDVLMIVDVLIVLDVIVVVDVFMVVEGLAEVVLVVGGLPNTAPEAGFAVVLVEVEGFTEIASPGIENDGPVGKGGAATGAVSTPRMDHVSNDDVKLFPGIHTGPPMYFSRP